jgi:hypothetical protein
LRETNSTVRNTLAILEEISPYACEGANSMRQVKGVKNIG